MLGYPLCPRNSPFGLHYFTLNVLDMPLLFNFIFKLFLELNLLLIFYFLFIYLILLLLFIFFLIFFLDLNLLPLFGFFFNFSLEANLLLLIKFFFPLFVFKLSLFSNILIMFFKSNLFFSSNSCCILALALDLCLSCSLFLQSA
jgi:hypothetical protein